jgi:hypothetical protein
VRIITAVQLKDGDIAISQNGLGASLNGLERTARDQSASINAPGENEIIHDLGAFIIYVAVRIVCDAQCPHFVCDVFGSCAEPEIRLFFVPEADMVALGKSIKALLKGRVRRIYR